MGRFYWWSWCLSHAQTDHTKTNCFDSYRLKEIAAWLKELPSSSAGRQPCGTLALDDGIVAAIEEAVDSQRSDRKKILTMQVRPHLLYKPNLSQGSSLPDPDTTFRLFDRVVNVREGFSVPLGLRGTVTGIHSASRPEDTIVEVLFDAEFSGGLTIRSTTCRSYRMPGSALINLSHGHRTANRGNHNNQKPTAVVPPLRDGKNSHQSQANYWEQRKQSQDAQRKHGHPTGLRTSGSVSKESSPLASAAKKFVPNPAPNMTPPDPKNLPKPSFSSQQRNSTKIQEGKYQQKGLISKHSPEDIPIKKNPKPPVNMEKLWQSLQGNVDNSLPPTKDTPQPPTNEAAGQDMSAQLKSMLNISGANTTDNGANRKEEPSETGTTEHVEPNVQNFFEAAASAVEGSNSSVINNDETCISKAENQHGRQQAAKAELMVPLQVSMKHVLQKKPSKDTEYNKKQDSADSADEKVRKWLSQGENFQQNREKNRAGNHNQGDKNGPKKQHQQQKSEQEKSSNIEEATSNQNDKKRTKNRLAANFGPKPQ